MKKLIVSSLLLIFMFCQHIGYCSSEQPVKVGIVELEYWGEEDPQSGAITGIYPSIIQELSQRLHIKTLQILAPYPRILDGIKTGQYDMTITLPDSDSLLMVGEKVWTIRLGVLSRKDKPVISIDQLSGRNVGVIRGAKFESKFDADTSINKVESVKHQNLLKMLDAGRIDAIASDLTILNGLIQRSGKKISDYADQLVVNELSLHVIMSSKSAHIHLNNKINETISKMIADGAIEKIILNYLHNSQYKK